MNAVPNDVELSISLTRRIRIGLTMLFTGKLSPKQIIRILMRKTNFDAWGVRPITQSRFLLLVQAARRIEALQDELVITSQELVATKEVNRYLVARNVILTETLESAENTIGHLRLVEREYLRAIDDLRVLEQEAIAKNEAADRLETRNVALNGALAKAQHETQRLEHFETDYAAAREGVQAIMNEWQRMLFEVAHTTGPSEAASRLVLGNRPVGESVATLINLSEESHGARPFQIAMPILAVKRPFPLRWREDIPALRIVDVGSEELSSENDMYAPLRDSVRLEVVGFDPFATLDGKSLDPGDSLRITRRSDGSQIKTFPALVGDGEEVTFHVNRYGPTSSILPSNRELTRQFGLLDLAVETIETRRLPSFRIDDLLPVEGEGARIDLLKIDVQGAAHAVLSNATKLLRNTLVCHVEIEFAPVYVGEKLFGDVDGLLRDAGFCFVDFFNLGRQRYSSFETSKERAFHRGRTLWGDCIYVRGLDAEDALPPSDLFRAALIVHSCYNKQDLAAELLARLDRIEGTELLKEYIGEACNE